MIGLPKIDYSHLDRPDVLRLLFHPRREWNVTKPSPLEGDLLIPVDKDVVVGARFHIAEKVFPNILFFHGNGEIVADYDEVGALYNRMGVNFLVADYRGYGRSTGEPTITAMMKDCHTIFGFVTGWLEKKGCTGPLVVMGRSLGSASALELAHRDRVDALIIESGFAHAGPLLQLLGIDVRAMGFREEAGFRNMDKIQEFDRPTLIIHAERDHIIPFSEGEVLYDASRAQDKSLIKVLGANHNDIFIKGVSEYLSAIRKLLAKVTHGGKKNKAFEKKEGII